MNEVHPFPRSVRLHGKTPRVDHIDKSIPIMVRDAILSRIKTIPQFATFNFSSNKNLQIQQENIPFCGVYFLQEVGIPQGDANAGEPRFRTTARYGFSIIIQNNDADKGEYILDVLFQAINGKLFSDPTLYHNKQFEIQAYTNLSRQHIFGALGQDNETPIIELRYELICDLGEILYPPLVLDDLETIHVTTAFPIDGTPAEQAAVQQVNAEYDLEQGD